MNRDDIIRMAREVADIQTDSRGREEFIFDSYGIEAFANLVAAAERERIIAANAPEIEKVNVYIKTLEDAVADEREACAKAQPDLAQVGEVGVWGERQWQGLTDEEIREFEIWLDDEEEKHGWNPPADIVKYIEAKLKEKNT